MFNQVDRSSSIPAPPRPWLVGPLESVELRLAFSMTDEGIAADIMSYFLAIAKSVEVWEKKFVIVV